MNQRLHAILREFIKTLRSFAGVSALLGGGILSTLIFIIELVPEEHKILASFCVSLFFIIVFIVVLCWNLSRYAVDSYWFNRKYKLISQIWDYSPNPDGMTYNAKCEGIREITCLAGSLSYINISMAPKENLTPFKKDDDYSIEISPQSRHPSGVIQARKPHRSEGSTFAFHIDFIPPLRMNETAYVKFSYRLQNFKVANLDLLRELSNKASLEAVDYQYCSWSVDYPIDHLHYEIRFTDDCLIQPRPPEARRETAVLTEEQKLLENPNKRIYTATNIGNGWDLVLDRDRPPINTTYRIPWTPPTKEQLMQKLSHG